MNKIVKVPGTFVSIFFFTIADDIKREILTRGNYPNRAKIPIDFQISSVAVGFLAVGRRRDWGFFEEWFEAGDGAG